MAKQPTFHASMGMVILHGKEPFLMTRYTNDLEQILKKEHGEIERIVFDGESVDLATVLDEVRTPDLLMKYKLVIVDNADSFLATKTTSKTSVRKQMERYAEKPVPSATMLLRATAWRPGKLDKVVNKNGLVYKLQQYNENDTMRWCVARCEKEHSCTLEPQGAELLVGRIGLSLIRLDTELGKLAAKVEPNTTILKADVLEMVGKSREEQAWEIQSCLLTGNESASLTKLCELLDISKQPRELLMWSVVDLTRRLSAAANMIESGSSSGEIRKSLKLFGDSGNRILSVAKRKTSQTFANLFTDAVAIDASTRTGMLDGRRGLESLALRVCREVR
ncbi:MAG TPA: DNA polymerase III subunit delta [Phycisphaerales bacterium]|nr:DNA polymerase III subunit delta [Phycisphaerales bacterium]